MYSQKKNEATNDDLPREKLKQRNGTKLTNKSQLFSSKM